MKRFLFTLLILFSAAIPVFAQRGYNSSIKVRLSDNSLVRVAIDRRYYPRDAKLLTVGNIPPGRHRIKVFVANAYGRSRRALVYDGYLRMSSSTSYYMIVDRNGGVRINSATLDDAYYNNRNGNAGDRDYYDFDRNYDDNNYDDRGRYGNDDQNDDRDRYNDDRRDNRNDNDGYNDRGNYGTSSGTFTQRDMDDLQRRVSSRITDTDKLKTIKTAAGSRTYTTEQVRVMMKWFNFDSSKMDLVKWAYDNVTDRRNYWKLESEFSFDSSKEEFNNFLNGGR